MAQLAKPWTLSGLERLSQPLEAPYRAFLNQVVANDNLHGRFLNTLSLLEHIGSRKIMLSHANTPPGKDVLKHMAEEARHAYFFCNKAEGFLKEPVNDYSDTNTLCSGAAKMYFGRLDSAIEQHISGSNKNTACYLWVSLIIELRAHWAYHIYQDVLQAHGKAFSLKSLIAEENMHLAEMFENVCAVDDTAHDNIAVLSAKEHALFESFFAQLQRAIS
jgi:hypothetical protein